MKFEPIINPDFLDRQYLADAIGEIDTLLNVDRNNGTVILQPIPGLPKLLPAVTRELKSKIDTNITLLARKGHGKIELFYYTILPPDKIPHYYFDDVMRYVCDGVTATTLMKAPVPDPEPQATIDNPKADEMPKKIVTPDKPPQTEVTESDTVMDKAIPEGAKKIEITCKNCGHTYNTVIYFNEDGTLDRKKTQARCGKCKRKNTATVLGLIENNPQTTYRSGQSNQITPENKGGVDPHIAEVKGNTEPKVTAPKVEVTVPNRITDYSPVKVTNTQTNPSEKGGIAPQNQGVITANTQPLALPTMPDMTPLFGLLHEFESNLLIAKRGKGIGPSEKELLDNLAQQMMLQAATNPAIAKILPWLPVIAYVIAQAVIIGGPSLVDSITGKKKEPEKKETLPPGQGVFEVRP